ncbi:hypothetical protein ABG775_06630 [Peribacillus simplex]|uniref:hypothetical protein n=1 Tax=Peribacillus TaxID=2675229 RepID=UPI0032E39783
MNRQTVLYNLDLFQLEGVIDTLVFPMNDFYSNLCLFALAFTCVEMKEKSLAAANKRTKWFAGTS